MSSATLDQRQLRPRLQSRIRLKFVASDLVRCLRLASLGVAKRAATVSAIFEQIEHRSTRGGELPTIRPADNELLTEDIEPGQARSQLPHAQRPVLTAGQNGQISVQGRGCSKAVGITRQNLQDRHMHRHNQYSDSLAQSICSSKANASDLIVFHNPALKRRNNSLQDYLSTASDDQPGVELIVALPRRGQYGRSWVITACVNSIRSPTLIGALHRTSRPD
ncbi:MAG: hypothetical protein HZA66_04635 [Rhodopseudomonas palustris]|uniref:Uncharacterized protein n=1 Tax=Rhodopseudomonas palustris TaxID=1076 RepID=A0A933VTG9_RHOPL|nr:hypothetical protein [Rhodopseudomonas palustris]